jgi:hypothetical protein
LAPWDARTKMICFHYWIYQGAKKSIAESLLLSFCKLLLH